MNPDQLQAYVDRAWQDDILPELEDYIRIPAKSPHFDADWERNGHIDAAVAQAEAWCRTKAHDDMRVELVQLPGRTPVLLVDIPGEAEGTVLLYGHLDKQPEMTGWAEGLDPWQPVLKDGRLYGRGGADDGYAVFASLTAILALREQGIPHARCVLLIETCEESGSYDLPAYIDHLSHRIGQPDLVICLDSGCGNYEQLWCTTSLRGMASGVLEVDILREGVHSGDASGVVPSSFRIARQLIERLEDSASGQILPKALHVPVPDMRREQAGAAARVLGETLYRRFPFVDGAGPVAEDLTELVLNRTWRPALSVTGAAGLPPLDQAGNVQRPGTALKLSIRLPPGVDGAQASAAVKALLEQDPPYGARVRFTPDQSATGWHAPALSDWLAASLDRASRRCFGAPVMYMGEGGTIPFMAMLGDAFPSAQFVITGVLGPQSNAHGPNEFLHVATARRLTSAMALVLADHSRRRSAGF
ncbi:MAG: M20 family metallopeptidase [Ectothiorhodospiraceae bacterium]|nr:M20 family metallopeptidase [Ectothiorhodospiraceae bacterium]